MTIWNCWLCEARHVEGLPTGCVPEIGNPEDDYSPQADSTLCPGCACSNPDDVLDCSNCGDGIEALTGYNPFVARHLGKL